MSRWRPSKIKLSWITIAWLATLWVILWGDLSWGNVVAGVVIGTLVPSLLPLPKVPFHGALRLWPLLVLVGRFLFDLVMASFQVALLSLNPGHRPHGAVIRVQLRSESHFFIAFTGILSSLVPGSVVVEALRSSGVLYVHVLDVEAMGGLDEVRQHIRDVEERLLRTFASRRELAATGLASKGHSR